jgi:hypothetical protein
MSEEKKTESTNEPELSPEQLDQVAGGAETSTLFLKANGADYKVVNAAREAGSGLPTGRRQYEP